MSSKLDPVDCRSVPGGFAHPSGLPTPLQDAKQRDSDEDAATRSYTAAPDEEVAAAAMVLRGLFLLHPPSRERPGAVEALLRCAAGPAPGTSTAAVRGVAASSSSAAGARRGGAAADQALAALAALLVDSRRNQAAFLEAQGPARVAALLSSTAIGSSASGASGLLQLLVGGGMLESTEDAWAVRSAVMAVVGEAEAIRVLDNSSTRA